MTTYPYGYSGAMLTKAELDRKQTVYKLHPEMWRRTFAMMEDAARQGVALGVGTGWRVQPADPRPGFAAPGNSNHEGFPADGVTGGAVACDMVPQPAWGWMAANCARFGLREFTHVNNEPWHIQPAEIPASRNYRTQPWVLAPFPLPGFDTPPPAPGDDFMTPQDEAWLTSHTGPLVWAAPPDPGSGLSSGKYLETINKNVFEIINAVTSLDPVAIQEAITEACAAALANATVTVDVAAIAEAVADELHRRTEA